MRAVFKDKSIEKEFQSEGYVRLPFLGAEQVKQLQETYFTLVKESMGNNMPGEFLGNPDYAITYDFTFIDKNIDYKRKTFAEIDKIFKPIYDQILDNYTPIIGNFIRKKQDNGEVPLHQNWSFIDEKKATSVSIWVPLVDSNVENGTLQVTPKSHKRFGQFRGPMVPWELEGIKNDIIKSHLVPLDTKAGDCVILDDSIVHYSAPNTTQGLRLTIQLILHPSEMQSIHYHLNPNKSNSKIEVLAVDHDFYMNFNPWKLPENETSINELGHAFKPLSEPEFVARLGKKRFDEKRSLLQRFFQ